MFSAIWFTAQRKDELLHTNRNGCGKGLQFLQPVVTMSPETTLEIHTSAEDLLLQAQVGMLNLEGT